MKIKTPSKKSDLDYICSHPESIELKDGRILYLTKWAPVAELDNIPQFQMQGIIGVKQWPTIIT